jgi:hypothetical protein
VSAERTDGNHLHMTALELPGEGTRGSCLDVMVAMNLGVSLDILLFLEFVHFSNVVNTRSS